MKSIPSGDKIKWSVGKGVWVSVPWIALMHRDETTTTQRGITKCYFGFLADELEDYAFWIATVMSKASNLFSVTK